MTERVLVGAIVGAHGVRGQVRIRCFTEEPSAVTAYGPLSDESGSRSFQATVMGRIKDGVIARIDGIADRAAAEALRGLRLYVPRSALPAIAADEYYRVDLIGLRAELADGTSFGRVSDVRNFGAGDLLEIERTDGATELLPFADRNVPVVDIAAGRVVVDPPVYVEARTDGADGNE
jgi:16S rRNA processing protein RimM